MKCFNCGYPMDKNDLSNCKVCGAKYPVVCASCNGHNPAHAHFCISCGFDLTQTNVITKNLKESKKHVGVLFADVSGFTKLSKMLDPEDVRELINDCFQYITRPVYELEGTIDKYIGDCVMVVFGNDISHNDDAFRTIKCAIEMMKLIDEFSQEKISKLKMKLNLSIGVNFGLVVSGNVGNLYESDYTVLGDTVNIAQRLQTSANPGEILASESIYSDTHELVHYGTEKEIKLKSIEKSVKAYQPISLQKETFFESQYIVKRSKDVELLNKHFEERDQFFYNIVSAPSGYGKTTLVKKVLSGIDQSIRKIWINSSNIFRDKPYYALSRIIATVLNINPEDTDRIKRNRLSSFSDYILSEYSEYEIIKNYNFIALILGLGRDTEYEDIINAMEYGDLQREIKAQISLFFQNISKRQDIYIVLDDAQMMDKESLETLSGLQQFSGFITFITQYPLDVFESCPNVILLDAFSMEETEFLIHSKLKVAVKESFLNTVYSTTNGNPMHITELLLAIKKNGLYEDDKQQILDSTIMEQLVTSSLNNIITRNIQTLGGNTLEFLTISSVIGNEFNVHWLLNLMKKEIDIDAILGEASKHNLIEFTSVKKNQQSVERIYSFTQNSTRLVIYNALLNKDKKRIHEDIAKFLENEYEDTIEQYVELLAYHYENSGNVAKAKFYFEKTAHQFIQNYNFDSAILNYEKYLTYEEKVSSQLIAMFAIGDIYINLSKYDLAFAVLHRASLIAKLQGDINLIDLMKIKIYKETTNFDEAIPLLESLSERLDRKSKIYGRLLQLKSAIYNMMGKQEVIDIAKQSEEILLKSRDYASLSETMSQAGIRYFISGDMQNGIEYLQKAYDYAKQSKNLNALTKISINLGIFSHASGEIDQSFSYLYDARDIALQVSNIKNYLTASINLGVFQLEKGLFSKAMLIFDEAISTSQTNNLVYQTCIALTNKADITYELGLYVDAVSLYQESKKLAQLMKLPIEEAINIHGIIKSNIEINKFDDTEEQLQFTKEIFGESNEVGYLVDNDLYSAIYKLKQNKPFDALLIIEQAIKQSIAIEDPQKEVQASRVKVEILLSLSKTTEAIDLIPKMLDTSLELDSDYEVAKTAFLACEVAVKMKDSKAENQYLDVAIKHIKNIDSCRIKNEILMWHSKKR